MTRFGLVIILILIAGKNYAQQDYFILIQADNKQSFYVRLGSRSLSSSSEGSLILSQLKDSTYSILVGFPGQVAPDQTFSVSLHHKDQQYILRSQGEKGWVLYNPLTGETKMADPAKEKGVEMQPQGVKKDDAFSRLMAGVVRDTAVMYNTYAMEQVLRDSPVAAPIRPDSANPAAISAATNPAAINPPTINPGASKPVSSNPGLPAVVRDSTTRLSGSTVQVADSATSGKDSSGMAGGPARLRSEIVQLSQRKMPHSLRLAFADRSPGKKTDTIIIFIMMDTVAVSKPPASVNPNGAGVPTSPAGKTARAADTSRGAGTPTGGPNSAGQVPVPAATANSGESAKPLPPAGKPLSTFSPAAKAPLPFVNSDCHDFATDYDVDKLRVKMLELSKDEDRIQAARKVFKTKCFSTKQIKALSEVFTTDALKYRFFETAYPFASDDHFRELGATLADPVYGGKFKTMTGQQ